MTPVHVGRWRAKRTASTKLMVAEKLHTHRSKVVTEAPSTGRAVVTGGISMTLAAALEKVSLDAKDPHVGSVCGGGQNEESCGLSAVTAGTPSKKDVPPSQNARLLVYRLHARRFEWKIAIAS